MSTFSNFSLLPTVQKSLDGLGFTTPTPIQAKLVPLLLDNPARDVHAQAQTGTGKTLAFGLPLLHTIDTKIPQAQGLVMAPTRELVLQIYESLKEVSRESGITITPIYGGMPIERQIRAIKKGAHIIVGTPGRLNDHLRRKTLSLKNIKTFVLDEADIMLDMGFREEIDEILKVTPKSRAIWLLSATIRSGIKQLIASHMQDVHSITAPKKDVVSTQVEQYYCLVAGRKRLEALARFIEAAPSFYGIVFVQTKALAAQVMEELVSLGFKANCLHGDMKQTLRNHVIKGFKKREFSILVATDVAARGIDIDDLTHVLNYTIPNEHENYIHRIGRTGRAGRSGVAISLVTRSETRKIKQLEKYAHTTLHEIPLPPIETIINAKMGAVSDYIEQSHAKTDDSPVHTALKTVIDSFTPQEIASALIHALQDKFFKSATNSSITDINQDPVSVPLEICLEAGSNKGLDEELVRDYLYSVCTLLPQDISKVRVLQKRTFISLPENRLDDCIALIKSQPIINTKVRVYTVEDTFRPRNPRRGGPRGRGRSNAMGKRRRS